MALRVLLVGLVASLGFELPTGQDLSSWARTGRVWVDARIAELSILRIEAANALALGADEAEPEPSPSTDELASTRADLVFEAAIDAMASEFAVDLARMEKPIPEETVVVVEQFSEMPPAEALDTISQVEAEENVEVDAQPPWPPSTPVLATIPQIEPASRIEKLTVAVRLTREAVNAWASLIQTAPVKVADEGSGQSY